MIESKSEIQPMAIEDFMAATPKRKSQENRPSRLDPHAAELVKLSSCGFSLFRIQEYLEKQNIIVSRTGIQKYLAKHQYNEIPVSYLTLKAKR